MMAMEQMNSWWKLPEDRTRQPSSRIVFAGYWKFATTDLTTMRRASLQPVQSGLVMPSHSSSRARLRREETTLIWLTFHQPHAPAFCIVIRERFSRGSFSLSNKGCLSQTELFKPRASVLTEFESWYFAALKARVGRVAREGTEGL